MQMLSGLVVVRSFVHNKDIDRIVNDIYERNLRWRLENGLPPPMEEDDDEPPAKRPSVLKALEEKKEEVKARPKKASRKKESREAAR